MSTQKTALIIIDMQQAMCSPTLPPRNNPEAEQNIAILLDAWRQAGKPVVHVRHISRSSHSGFAPGQVGAAFQTLFLSLAHEHIVEKNVPDAFICTGLERWLHVRDINNVVIVGVSTNNSVESTARSAGNLGFSTVVLSDACFAFEQRDFAGTKRSADDVHFMSLANLHGDYATVQTSGDYLAGVNN